MRYIPNHGPKQWYKDSELTVTPDRLAFYEDACVVGSVQAKRGPVSTPMKAKAGGGPEYFDLPPERKPVNYLAVKCAHSLVTRTFEVDGKTIIPPEVTPALTWYIIVRSPTEIDMPFLGGSYIKLRKSTPAS